MIFIKFIFPKNYNYKSKLFGNIDYSTAIINIIWYVIVFLILNSFSISFTLKLCIFVTFSLPLFLFSIIGFHGENVFFVFLYVIKYFFSQKIYFYK